MKKFTHRFRVGAPIKAVAAFHSDTRALQKLTPFPMFVQLHEIEPLAENSRARFTIWAGPIPLRWEALHTNVTPQGFSDTQVSGPFKYWKHNHVFEALTPKSTAVIDEVSAIPGEGIFWGLATRVMILSLPLLFAYRGWQTRRSLEKRG
ncbi:MAG TPA: hypothetical protein DEH25_00240 [Chloroflexi bacterium]|nr:hypothetical protein [Chloroflexota bacterium]